MRLSKEMEKFWKAHIDAQKLSGLSVNRYCKEHNLVHHKFMYHKKKKLKSRNTTSPARFLPVEVEKKESFSLEVLGIKVGFDLKTPPAVIAAIIVEVSKQNEIS